VPLLRDGVLRAIIFKNLARTSKRTPDFTITKINWLMLFKEVIAVYTENHMKSTHTKYTVTDNYRRWYINLPLGFKWVMSGTEYFSYF
jgi:hypothetical protein